MTVSVHHLSTAHVGYVEIPTLASVSLRSSDFAYSLDFYIRAEDAPRVNSLIAALSRAVAFVTPKLPEPALEAEFAVVPPPAPAIPESLSSGERAAAPQDGEVCVLAADRP